MILLRLRTKENLKRASEFQQMLRSQARKEKPKPASPPNNPRFCRIAIILRFIENTRRTHRATRCRLVGVERKQHQFCRISLASSALEYCAALYGNIFYMDSLCGFSASRLSQCDARRLGATDNDTSVPLRLEDIDHDQRDSEAKSKYYIAKSSKWKLSGEFWSVVLPWIALILVAALAMWIKGKEWCQDQVESLFDWLNNLPLFPHTAALIAVIWVPCVWLSVPGIGVTLQLYSGYRCHQESTWIFGGLLTISSMILASFACFSLGRYWTKPVNLSSNKYLRLLLADNWHHLVRSVIVLRLSPLLPFTLISFLLGKVPSIGWRMYIISSALGMLPSSLLFAYFGSVAKTVAELFDKPDASSTESNARRDLVARYVVFAGTMLTIVAGGGIAAHLLLLNRPKKSTLAAQEQDIEMNVFSSSYIENSESES